jgi:hypothetical protein
LITEWRPEKLEPNTVETIKTGRTSQPKVPIRRLRQGLNGLRRAFLKYPSFMDNPLISRDG